MSRPELLSRLARSRPVLLALLAALVLGACSGGGKSGVGESTLALRVGQCIQPPTTAQAELATVAVVPCSTLHTQEVYAVPTYNLGPTGATADFPGAALLKTFAEGACAQAFSGYVGIAYADSSLFLTYLLPSPRGWQDGGDRKVVCIASTTGQQLRVSVRNSKT